MAHRPLKSGPRLQLHFLEMSSGLIVASVLRMGNAANSVKRYRVQVLGSGF